VDEVRAEGSPRDVLRRTFVARSEVAASVNAEEKGDPPVHWPSLGAIPAEREWAELRHWVDELRERYPGLDSYVVPTCWYEHESLVVALQALKDHERVAYAKNSPGSGGTDWHRAFRDITALLHQFTADLRCGHGPEHASRATFDDFVVEDIARRRRRAATVALGHPENITE
jgi:hypothetical protein